MRSYKKKWQTQQQISDFSPPPPTLSSSTVTVDFYGTACSATLPAAKCDEQPNSNAPTYSGTRRGKEDEEEDFVYTPKGLLSVTTTICISTQLLPHAVLGADVRWWLSEWG